MIQSLQSVEHNQSIPVQHSPLMPMNRFTANDLLVPSLYLYLQWRTMFVLQYATDKERHHTARDVHTETYIHVFFCNVISSDPYRWYSRWLTHPSLPSQQLLDYSDTTSWSSQTNLCRDFSTYTAESALLFLKDFPWSPSIGEGGKEPWDMKLLRRWRAGSSSELGARTIPLPAPASFQFPS